MDMGYSLQAGLHTHLADVAACGYVPGGSVISCSNFHFHGSLVSTSCTMDDAMTVTKKRRPEEKASGMNTQEEVWLLTAWAGCTGRAGAGRGRGSQGDHTRAVNMHGRRSVWHTKVRVPVTRTYLTGHETDSENTCTYAPSQWSGCSR